MAASAAAASVAVRGNQVAPVARSPQIVENNAGISSAEDEELRQIAASAEGQVAERTMAVYTEKQEKRGKITKKPWYIIDPRTSKFISYWDGISMVPAARTREHAAGSACEPRSDAREDARAREPRRGSVDGPACSARELRRSARLARRWHAIVGAVPVRFCPAEATGTGGAAVWGRVSGGSACLLRALPSLRATRPCLPPLLPSDVGTPPLARRSPLARVPRARSLL
jgi:hypothetical protein